MDNCRIKYILKADLSQFLDFYTEFKFRYEEVYARLSDLIDKIPRNELMKQGYPSDLQQFDLVPIINNLFLDTIKELKEIFTPSNCLIKLIDKEKKETDDLFGDLSSYGCLLYTSRCV